MCQAYKSSYILVLAIVQGQISVGGACVKMFIDTFFIVVGFLKQVTRYTMFFEEQLYNFPFSGRSMAYLVF